MSSLNDGEADRNGSGPAWRRSSFCASGECIEVAAGADGSILVRDSKDPEAGSLRYSPDEFGAFVRGVVAGEFDDLAGL
jgi:uncharacterized protein DUF397